MDSAKLPAKISSSPTPSEDTIIDEILSPGTMAAIAAYKEDFGRKPRADAVVAYEANHSKRPMGETYVWNSGLDKYVPILPRNTKTNFLEKKMTEYMPVKKSYKPKKRMVNPRPPSAPVLRPRQRDLSAIEVLDLTQGDARIVYDLTGE